MALLSKLLEKTHCSVCGSDTALRGWRKLADGRLCRSCTAKLSPWYCLVNTAETSEVSRQLLMREENRERAREFYVTNSYGEGMRLLADMEHRWFAVTGSTRIAEDNPDIIDMTACEGVDISIREDQKAQQEKDNSVRYDFYVTLHLNHPYLNEISWKLNPESAVGKDSDDYRKYDALAEEIYHVMSRKYNIETTGSFPAVMECPCCGEKTAMTESGRCPKCGGLLKPAE